MNPFNPLGQTWPGEPAGEVEGEEEGSGAGLEVTDVDLEQLPSSSGASAKMARDGALTLSDEEVLEEAMGRAQPERSELRARSRADSGWDGGGRGGSGRGGSGRGGRGSRSRGGGRGGSQQPTSDEQEWATAMGVLSGAGEVEEGDGGKAGAAQGEEKDDGGDESSSLGEDIDDTPSWVLGGFESAEAGKEFLEREQRKQRMCERIAESQRACKELAARIKELERESGHRG